MQIDFYFSKFTTLNKPAYYTVTTLLLIARAKPLLLVTFQLLFNCLLMMTFCGDAGRLPFKDGDNKIHHFVSAAKTFSAFLYFEKFFGLIEKLFDLNKISI